MNVRARRMMMIPLPRVETHILDEYFFVNGRQIRIPRSLREEEEVISNVNPPASASSGSVKEPLILQAAKLKRRECGIEGGRASVAVCPLEFQEE